MKRTPWYVVLTWCWAAAVTTILVGALLRWSERIDHREKLYKFCLQDLNTAENKLTSCESQVEDNLQTCDTTCGSCPPTWRERMTPAKHPSRQETTNRAYWIEVCEEGKCQGGIPLGTIGKGK